MDESTNNPAPGDSRPLVFVADDEPMLLELATAILQPQGFRVRTFRDPELALQAFASCNPPPALVITDYLMHTMNGMALIEKCRRIRPRQKILLVSGTVDEGVYRDSPVKPDRFLAKPYQPEQLVAVVRSVLAQ